MNTTLTNQSNKPSLNPSFFVKLSFLLWFCAFGFTTVASAQCIGPYQVFEGFQRTSSVLNNVANGWDVTVGVSGVGTTKPYGGTYSAVLSADSYYIRTPKINTPGIFTFKYAVNSLTNNYSFRVSVSTDNTNWTNVGGIINTTGSTLVGGSTSNFAVYTVDLSSYTGVYVRVQDTRTTDGGTFVSTWYVDDMAWTSTVATDNTIIIPYIAKPGTASESSTPVTCTSQSILYGTTYNMYDSGGLYDTMNNTVKDNTLTFTPGTSGKKIKITLLANTANGTLYIYSGTDTSNLIFKSVGNVSFTSQLGLNYDYVSEATNGEITVRYTSVAGTATNGLQLKIECVDPCASIPSVTSTTPGSRCGTGTVSLSATVTASATIRWYDATTGTMIAAPSTSVFSATTPSISATTNYYVEASSAGCAQRVPILAVITASPTTPAAITGSATPCQGSTLTYSTTAVAGENYTWTVPSDWTILSGQNSSSISVLVGTVTTGGVKVTSTTACSTSAATSLTITSVTAVTAPTSITISPGTTTSTSGSQTFTCTAVAGATSYNWVFPSGWTVTSGSGTNAVTVTVTATRGTVSASANLACGTSAVTSIIMTNTGMTSASITGTNTSLCSGSSTSLTASGGIPSSVTNYSFSASSGTFTALSGSTAVTAVNVDDGFSAAIPLNFTFTYAGQSYTSVYASSNGFLSFNSSATGVTATVNRTNALASATTTNLLPMIAPLWDDLSGATTGTASYLTTGTTGNRIFTFEWLNWKWNFSVTSAVISFQVKLYEADGHIDFVYSQNAGTVSTASASIGLAGGANGQYLSLNGSGSSPTASSSTETTTISTKPATGQVYTFKPNTVAWTSVPSGFTAITNTVSPSPTVTTTYTATFTSGSGGLTTSNTYTVSVGSIPTLASTAVASSVCTGSAATINLTGMLANSKSTILYNIGGGSNYTAITTTATAGGACSFTTIPLNSSHNGKVLTITSITCTDTSNSCASSIAANNTATLTVSSSSAVGGISSATTICSGATTTLSIASATGSIQWQQSSDNTTWSNVTGGSGATTLSYTTPALSSNTYYKVVVSSGACSSASSSSALVTVVATGSAVGGTASASVSDYCQGTNNSSTLSLSGYTGNVQWQQSTDNGVTWVNVYGVISGSTASSTFTSAYLPNPTQYRALVTNGCSSAYSNVVVINVGKPTVNATPDATICSNTITALTATGTATSYTWTSTPSGVLFLDAAATTPYTGAAATVYVKTSVTATIVVTGTSAAGCSNTRTVTLTVNSKTWNGSAWTPSALSATDGAIIAGPYTGGSITACSCTVNMANASDTVTFNSGDVVTLVNDFNVNKGTVVFNAGASLIQSADYDVNYVDPTNASVTFKQTTTISTNDYVYWSSPVKSFDVTQISPSTPTSYIWQWDPLASNGNGVGSGNWIHPSSNTMSSGVGYIVRGPNGYSASPYTASFVGAPKNGTVTVPVSRGTVESSAAGTISTVDQWQDNWNLIGNPYPSALDLVLFLNYNAVTNPVIQGTAYLWTHNTAPSSAIANPYYNTFVSNYTPNDYTAYNASGYVGGPTGFAGQVASGQGFFVLMNDGPTATANVTFSNSMRNGSNSQFFKSSIASALPAQERHRIWLDLVNPNSESVRTLVGYCSGATNNNDIMYDAIMGSSYGNSIFSILNSQNLTIQGRALPFDYNDTVALGYNASTTGDFTIAIAATDGLFAQGQGIYLEDKLLNVIHDLKQSPYVFATSSGLFLNRFVLRYTNALSMQQNSINNADVKAFVKDQQLMVSASKGINVVAVYDVTGKLIKEYKMSQNANLFETDFFVSNGIYFAKITLEDGSVVTEKLSN